jgi:hypothetical protein
MNLETFAKRTNYKLLLQQKQTLLKIINPDLMGFVDPDRDNHIEGLLNFLDTFQDAVADSGVLPEAEVFPTP